MDYKYINQLLERYWNADTSLEEERILRNFFRQKEIPAELAPYAALFRYEQAQAEEKPGDDFDARLLSIVEAKNTQSLVVPARRFSFTRMLRPFWQAAASVAIVTLVGIAASKSFQSNEESAWDYNPNGYNDTYNSPQQAYRVLEDGLEMFQRTANVAADTLNQDQKSLH